MSPWKSDDQLIIVHKHIGRNQNGGDVKSIEALIELFL